MTAGLVIGELITNAIQADANTIDVSVELLGRHDQRGSHHRLGAPLLYPPATNGVQCRYR
jgi:hypothetical protein